MTEETYTPGYSEEAERFVRRRRADRDAYFFLPHLQAGMRLLDCGCGPGTITIGLAERVAPGEVIGMDRESSQLDIARELAAGQGPAIDFQPGSAYRLPFPDHSFDAVFSHALLEHLKQPVEVLREFHRVLRPGGVAGVRCPDWGGFLIHPMGPLLLEAIGFYRNLQVSNGGDVLVGRKLGSLLREAGFARVRPSASYETHEPSVIGGFIAYGIETAEPAAMGAEESSLASMAEECRRWSREPNAFFAQAWGEGLAWRE
jgi:ubiquinone/menaquinone biosynthesis C-methylase UbiE